MNLQVVKYHVTVYYRLQYQLKQATELAVWEHCWSHIGQVWQALSMDTYLLSQEG